MNPIIQTQFAFADPNASPLTINELIALLNTLVASQIIPENTYIPYVIGHDEPGVDDRDKAWIQTSTAGVPIALKVWTSTGSESVWRRVYNGMVGEIRGFSGAPGLDVAPALFDKDGRGNIGLEYDGWQLCNGKNGSPNLSDRFILGGHMDASDSQAGYGDNGWQAFLDTDGDGTKEILDNTTPDTNGAAGTMIVEKHLPPFSNAMNDPVTFVKDPPGLWLYGREAKEASTTHTDTSPLVDSHYAAGDPPTGPGQHKELLIHYGADPPGTTNGIVQLAFPTLPPFYVAAWIVFIGY